MLQHEQHSTLFHHRINLLRHNAILRSKGNGIKPGTIQGEPGEKPDAPQVNDVTEDEVSGTGIPEAELIVRDSDGEEVARGTVDDDGNWAIDISGLECDEEYTVTQTVGDEESDPTSFTTVAAKSDN
jgi:hypothetical protein